MIDQVVETLMLDLLEWLRSNERRYEEVMGAWRTSCPRLPVWEEANDRGLVTVVAVNGRCVVRITALGRELLEVHKRSKTNPQWSRKRGSMRRLISSGSTFEREIGYSRAVVDGDWVFVAGTTGFDYKTMTISNDVVEQAEQCMRNIEAALAEAGSGIFDVVRVRYILPKARDFESCWPVLKSRFSEVRPAATMIAAGLSDPRMKIEIEVTARKSRAA